jgi:hypothetical protein
MRYVETVVCVRNRFPGPVFGYRGRFMTRFINTGTDTGTAPVPAAVRRLRENPCAWTPSSA